MPQPEGPSSASVWPAPTVKETSSSTGVVPKRWLTPCTRSSSPRAATGAVSTAPPATEEGGAALTPLEDH